MNEKWDYEGSRHDMSDYLLDKKCPNTLYLLCNKILGNWGLIIINTIWLISYLIDFSILSMSLN
ncbi:MULTISPECIES: Imm43 family immunity protein [Photorhabdus]|uniref:Imm43 family immunity protein n=1 Tax=Photorhabdus TaxID=29487 RepID=UPI0011145C03